MKKNTKFICVLCICIASLASCRKEQLNAEAGLKNNQNKLAIAGDEKWDLLGHGYDVTDELFERTSASDVSILDIDRFNDDYPGRIVTPTDTKGDYNVYYGATVNDYIRDFNEQRTKGIKASYGNSNASDSSLYGTADFSKTKENQSTYTYNSKYSYASYESWYRIKTIDFTGDATVDLLKNYLTPLFLANLSNYTPEQFIERYGTHVLLGIDIGGRLKYDYRGTIVKETTFERKKRAVKAGFSIGIAKMFSVDISSDVTKEEKTTISNETTDKLFRGTFYGGNNSGTNFSGDALGNTSVNINLIAWQQSINPKNAALININRSVPIYDFITDPVKKQQIKTAVEAYIASKQITELGEVPVFEFFSPSTGNRVLTINPNDYPYVQNGWTNFGVKFYAFPTPKPGTSAIHSFTKNSTHQHVYTKNPNDYPYLANGFFTGGIAFYAYANQITGTVPVHVFYSPSTVKHTYTAYPNEYAYTSNGWQNFGIGFYAYPRE